MAKSDNVFLVGPMGAGKTTIGKQLALAMGVPFLDSDTQIEQRTGVNIPLIFELEGESGFRAREVAIIDEITQQHPIVLATGGGVVLDPNNRAVLKQRGTVIYLMADVTQLILRTKRDRNRPLLQNDNPEAVLRNLMETRGPLYQEVADLQIDTGKNSVRTAVTKIIQFMSKAHT